MAPTLFEDENGQVKKATIKTYGDVVHSLIERKEYKGTFWPGFVPYSEIADWTDNGPDVGLIVIDHVVGNVELGAMNKWVSFYEQTLGFSQLLHFTDDDISTEYSALMSKVMHNGNGKIKFPINEPAQGKRKSQIEEYLEFHNGAGVQHIACGCKDIIKTVSALKERGVQFLSVPKTYYDEIPNRVGSIKEDMTKIAALGVLVDRDDDGYLLQLFTKPVHDRPTLFFEIIQREGSRGFGVGNFKALFQAIEREQAKRGNL
jgi:4-hydroxyphenylpyruvate dioxygenase